MWNVTRVLVNGKDSRASDSSLVFLSRQVREKNWERLRSMLIDIWRTNNVIRKSVHMLILYVKCIITHVRFENGQGQSVLY